MASYRIVHGQTERRIGLLSLTRCESQNGRIAINARDIGLRLVLLNPDGESPRSTSKIKDLLARRNTGLVDKCLLKRAFPCRCAHDSIIEWSEPMKSQGRNVLF